MPTCSTSSPTEISPPTAPKAARRKWSIATNATAPRLTSPTVPTTSTGASPSATSSTPVSTSPPSTPSAAAGSQPPIAMDSGLVRPPTARSLSGLNSRNAISEKLHSATGNSSGASPRP